MQSSRGHSGTCTGLGGKQGTRIVTEWLGKDSHRLFPHALPLHETNHSSEPSSSVGHGQNLGSSTYGESRGSRRLLFDEDHSDVRSRKLRLSDDNGISKGIDVFSFKASEDFFDVNAQT